MFESFALLARRRRAAPVAAQCIALLLALSGCAALAPVPGTGPRDASGAPVRPADAEPPPPNVNLSGFPLRYRQGYADGCASAKGSERKDAAQFAADGNYRTGWQDGRAMCR